MARLAGSPPRLQIAAVLLLFVTLAATYAWVTPAFEAPDEASHFLYIHYLADTGELPVLEDRAAMFASQSVQRHHPPLYYLLGAALVGWIDRSDVGDLLRPNPFASIGTVSSVNQNAFLHPPDGAGSGALWAVRLLRVFGIALGAGTVWLVYRAGRALGGGHAPGLASALLVACLPGFIFVSASVNNDTLVIFLSSAGIVLLLEAWRDRKLTAGKGAVLGLILGGIALTKVNGLSLAAVTGVWAVIAVINGRFHWRALVVPLLLAFGIAVTVSAWWYVRNVMLYGDPLALAATLRVWGRGAALPTWAEAAGVWDSFWLVLGQFNVRGPDWFYVLYVPALVLAGLACTLWAARQRRIDRGLVLFLLLTVLASVTALAAATSRINVSQGRILYPALAAVAPLLVVGLRRLAPPVVTALALAPLVLFALAAPLLLRDAYPQPQAVDAVPVGAQTIGADAEGLRLEALQWADAPLRTGDVLDMTLFVSGANVQNPFLTLRAVHPDTQAVLGSVNVYPGMLPTDSLPGSLLAVPLHLPLEGVVDRPVQLQLLLGWEAPGASSESASTRLLMQIGGETVDTVRLTGPVLLPESAALPAVQRPLNAVFGEALRLDGVSLERGVDGDGAAALDVTLNFTPIRELAEDYTMTLGVLSADGQLIAQADGPLAGYPSSAWLPGVPFAERRTLTVGGPLTGDETVFVGWYSPLDGSRLPVTGEAAQDNLLLLPAGEGR